MGSRAAGTAAAGATGSKGTGLGLSLVRAVAHAHGGEVRVRSTPGVGSEFELVLPGPGGQRRDAVPRAPAELVQQLSGARAGPDPQGQPMAKQEPMTQEPTSTQEHDELSGPTPAAPGRGIAGRGVAGWFGRLSSAPELALTWSALGPGRGRRAAGHRRLVQRGTQPRSPAPGPGVHPRGARAPGPAHLADPVRRPPPHPELLRVLVRAVPAGNAADRTVLPQPPARRHRGRHRRQRHQLGRSWPSPGDGRGLPGRVRPCAHGHGAVLRR